MARQLIISLLATSVLLVVEQTSASALDTFHSRLSGGYGNFRGNYQIDAENFKTDSEFINEADNADIQRVGVQKLQTQQTNLPQLSKLGSSLLSPLQTELGVPIYASPILRSRNEREPSRASFAPLPIKVQSFDELTSNSNGAFIAQPTPLIAPEYAHLGSPQQDKIDLKVAASYGQDKYGYDKYSQPSHNYHLDEGYGASGWLDMGAYTGDKGAFGWYSDYPVGKQYGGYGYKR